MDGPKRKLVVFLCMHRSGSSLTANILQRLGMSLGPFDLIEAAPSNPYGHFESIPFHSLNRRVQEWAFGFADDVPNDPGVLARFVESQGAWPNGRDIPEEWLEEGERVTRVLIASGEVSGFKDPRTVLCWPFWRRVFSRIEGLEVVRAMLLRSPHEIAMSLCDRSKGDMPYWNALDVVSVHLARMRAIVGEQEDAAPTVRFGTKLFWDDMKSLVERSGLDWNDSTVREVFDPSCVHHQPAAVAHDSQRFLNELGDHAWSDIEPSLNAERIARDSRKYEATTHAKLASTRCELGRTLVQLRQAEQVLSEHDRLALDQQLKADSVHRELIATQHALGESEKGFQLARTCLEQTEQQLARVMETLVTNQERRVQAEQMLAHTQGVLAHAELTLTETQRRLAEANAQQERSLKMFQQSLAGTQFGWDADRKRLEAALERVAQVQDASTHKEQQLVRSLEREEKRWLENVALRRRLERFESNTIIGAAVKGRRRIKQFWLKFRPIGPTGEPRATRVDRPM